MSSILNDVKHKIGPSEDYSYYDRDIIDAINLAIGVLTQAGVGPVDGFSIADASTEWNDYVTDKVTQDIVKSYIYLYVRKIFDPPNSSTVMQSIDSQLQELIWRLNVEANYLEAGIK